MIKKSRYNLIEIMKIKMPHVMYHLSLNIKLDE